MSSRNHGAMRGEPETSPGFRKRLVRDSSKTRVGCFRCRALSGLCRMRLRTAVDDPKPTADAEHLSDVDRCHVPRAETYSRAEPRGGTWGGPNLIDDERARFHERVPQNRRRRVLMRALESRCGLSRALEALKPSLTFPEHMSNCPFTFVHV